MPSYALGDPERVAALTLIASRPNTPGPVDDDLGRLDDALMEVIMPPTRTGQTAASAVTARVVTTIAHRYRLKPTEIHDEYHLPPRGSEGYRKRAY